MASITDSCKFNDTSDYFIPSTRSTISGVLSLNGLSGEITITSPDASVGVTASPALISLSTAGTAQAPASVTASGAIAGATLASSGNATIGGALSVAGISTLTGALGVSGIIRSGTGTVAAAIPNATTQPLTALNTLLATLNTRNYFLFVSFGGTITPVNPSGLPTICGAWSVPPTNVGSGTGAVSITGAANQNLNTAFNILTDGPAGSRVTTLTVTCGAGGGYTINAGGVYSYIILLT